MNIEEFIIKIEVEHLDSALESLAKSPKDLVSIYLNALEFQRAKLMRANAIPKTDKDELIKIEIVTQSDTDIQENTRPKS